MEVKTVNESDDQPPEFLPVLREIPTGLQTKLHATIAQARNQLISLQGPAIKRRIALLFVRLDFHVEAAGHLGNFLRLQETADVEIWWRLLKP
ncbi:MAG TPA: hypothetical protein VFE97_03960 [Methylomirabilota bacterium]|nr:hypothetical protein [Methylomirabilota bacterium]